MYICIVYSMFIDVPLHAILNLKSNNLTGGPGRLKGLLKGLSCVCAWPSMLKNPNKCLWSGH